MRGAREGAVADFVSRGMGSLRASAEEMGYRIGEDACRAIAAWFEFYRSWPGRRVVGMSDPGDIAVKIVADSFAFLELRCLPEGDALDLGSGNGWPGLAVRLHDPARPLWLLDSRASACSFMRGFLRFASLDGVTVVEARAEEAVRRRGLAGRFGLVTTRAMCSPGLSLETASGFLRRAGAAVLWLGPARERAETPQAIPELGVALLGQREYRLPGGAGERSLVAYESVSPPMPGYPRRPAGIRARPLI